jgi:hypothetical protein
MDLTVDALRIAQLYTLGVPLTFAAVAGAIATLVAFVEALKRP